MRLLLSGSSLTCVRFNTSKKTRALQYLKLGGRRGGSVVRVLAALADPHQATHSCLTVSADLRDPVSSSGLHRYFKHVASTHIDNQKYFKSNPRLKKELLEI